MSPTTHNILLFILLTITAALLTIIASLLMRRIAHHFTETPPAKAAHIRLRIK